MAIPFLPSLAPTAAVAQSVTLKPKRLITFYTPYGSVYSQWNPSVPASNLIGPDIRERTLASVAGDISGILGARFTALKEKLLLVRGLDGLVLFDHGGAFGLAGNKGNEDLKILSLNQSIDQILAKSPKIYATEPKLRSLHLTPGSTTDSRNFISFAKTPTGAAPVPVIQDPRIAFEKLFGGLDAGLTDAQKLARRNRNLGVIDRVLASYNQVMGSSRLSSLDKQRLESHVQMIRDLEKSIQETEGGICAGPANITGMTTDFSRMVTQHIDIMVAAIRCDLTRIGTISLGESRTYNWLPNQISHHHSMSHSDEPAAAGLTAINQWWANKFAELLEKLNVVEDATTGRTYLDNSIAYWCNEQTSHGILNHRLLDMPVLLAGGAGTLATGRYVDYRRPGNVDQYSGVIRGRVYNSLLVTILQAMGLAPAEYEENGVAGFGEYRYRTNYDTADATMRSPLPSLLKS
ncbi:MAG TPA: DUF1552 domain-containing protein [Bdellovibrionales bacterium]|nr:DUF1552 domain-containing protein [Bdellovibrionales bacterium]